MINLKKQTIKHIEMAAKVVRRCGGKRVDSATILSLMPTEYNHDQHHLRGILVHCVNLGLLELSSNSRKHFKRYNAAPADKQNKILADLKKFDNERDERNKKIRERKARRIKAQTQAEKPVKRPVQPKKISPEDIPVMTEAFQTMKMYNLQKQTIGYIEAVAKVIRRCGGEGVDAATALSLMPESYQFGNYHLRCVLAKAAEIGVIELSEESKLHAGKYNVRDKKRYNSVSIEQEKRIIKALKAEDKARSERMAKRKIKAPIQPRKISKEDMPVMNEAFQIMNKFVRGASQCQI